MKDYAIGYGKTDPKTRWKKGQCGNPQKKRPLKIPSLAGMVEEEWAKIYDLKERGERRRLTGFEVMLLRLLPKVACGNKRAMRILKKYQAYAQAHPTVVYEPETDPEEAAAQYRKLLEEGIQGPRTKEEAEYDEAFRKLTAREAAEIYADMLKNYNGQ